MKRHSVEQWRRLRVAFFLAYRYVTRTSAWQTVLVVTVMTLTFLNLVVVNGILVGLIDGALLGYNRNYAGDVLISKLPEKDRVEYSAAIRGILDTQPYIAAYSARIIEPGIIEANYQEAVSNPDLTPDRVSTSIAGIQITDEEQVTNLSGALIEGTFLTERDDDGVVVGSNLLDRYFPSEVGLQTLSGVYPGDKIRITVNEITREFIVRGVVKTKADATDLRVFMIESELTKLSGVRGSSAYDEFALRLDQNTNPIAARDRLLSYGIGTHALVRTTGEAIGEFLDEIKDTFSVLGNIIGGISVIGASITIFIIIFISAITRQKYIGILKAIGISGMTIELSYVFLSLFYSIVGIIIGFIILYGVLLPYFTANPIDFPFSDGILSVTLFGSVARSLVIILTTIIAGYIPARIIVQKNTLDAILGR